MKQKNICLARVAKNIAYMVAPIFAIILIASIISLAIMDSDIRLKDANNYYETRIFSDRYLNSIYENYNRMKNIIAQEKFEKEYEHTYIQSAEPNENKDNIYYFTNYNTNFYYLIIDAKEQVIITNLEHTMRTDDIQGIIGKLKENSLYWNFENKEIDTSISNLKMEDIRYNYQFENILEDEEIMIYTSLLNNVPYSDVYGMSKVGYDFAIKMNSSAPILIPVSIIALVICMFIIMHGIGRVAKQEEIYLNWFDKWKLEIVLMIGIAIMLIGVMFFVAIDSGIRTIIITGFTIGFVIIYLGCILMLETLVKRLKTHTMLKSTIIYSILRSIKELVDNFQIATKLIIFFWGFCLLGFILTTAMATATDGGELWFTGGLLLTQGILSFKYLLKKRQEFEKIEQALKSIYEGNTKISLKPNEMKGVLKRLATYVEDIAGGLSNAVNESLKSERLKTELITNVSHDIKTPLTSIINYVDLLKKEEMPNEKCTEYLNILDSKSQRLKKLTEDLVEASKASSGNIKLQIENINVVELIKQVSGEFEDKFQSRGLEEIMTVPEETVFIKADGRYMYRVLENIYSNSAKYAMENSRIYVDVIAQPQSVVIQMKNISQEKLNISADELMQRFVRGEASRNTEGSGLGLSIAESLTQLQNGKFHIYLDGDLFKITIGFERKF